MVATSSTNVRRLGAKGFAVAFASCAFGLVLMILVLRSNSQRDSMPEGKNSPAKENLKKIQPAWNIALGNVVVIAPDLRFSVKGPKNAKIELSRINGKIEAQLLPVRELYRLESDRN